MSGIGLPAVFTERMAEQLGNELPAFLACFSQPALRGVRMNPLKPAALEAQVEGLGEPVPWAKYAYYLDGRSRAGAHPLHEAGAYYIQEPSAMLPASVLAARPGESVLDLCAAPGGKTTQIGAMLKGSGLLVSNEPVLSRAQVLSRNVERMGIVNALVISAWPEALAARWPGAFDAVLADVPCSGEGMFRRDPEARGEWTTERAAGCAARQAGILDAAAEMVRPGGRLVYATCTYNPAENEDGIAAFLKRRPDFELSAFELPGAAAPDGLLTVYPHRMAGEGQFAALLVRSGNEPAARAEKRSLPKPDKAAAEALRLFAPGAPSADAVLRGTLVLLPGMPDLTGLQVLRCGLHLGSLNGRVFQPDHAWAVSACPPDAPRIPVDDATALRWQAGETIAVPDSLKGWALPTLNGLPLGWGKASNGVLKNHYPKGLRRPI